MHPKYRALIWEQFRIYGNLCFLLYVLTLPICLGFYYSIQEGNLIPRDILDFFPFIMMPTYIFTLLLLLGPINSDKRVRIADSFEPRLFLLPVSTFALVFVVFLSRLMCLILMYMSVYVTTRIALGAYLPANYFLVPMLIYLCLQAAFWAGDRVRNLVYLSGVGAIAFLFFRPDYPLQIIEMCSGRYSIEIAFVGLAISIGAFGIAWLGVHYQRIEQHASRFSLRDIQLWFNALYAPPARKFHSPMEAQIWFERRHIGRLLPFSFFILLIVSIIILWPLRGVEDLLFKYYYVLALASLFTGFRVLAKSRSTYVFLRPISTGNIARAKMYIIVRALFFILCFAPLFALAGSFFVAEKGYFLTRAWQDGVIDSMRIASLLINPVLAAGVVAWVFLWLRSWIAIPTLMLLGSVNFFAVSNSLITKSGGLSIPLPDFAPYALWSTIIVCVISICAAITAWRKHLVSRTHLLLVISCWAILVLIMRYMPFSPRIPGEMVLYVAFLIALVHLPFTAIPITLWGQRVGEKGPYL